VGAPCSQWIACSPVRNGGSGRPLNWVVRRHMSHEALVAVVMLGVVALGGAGLWAVRTRSRDWADQYDNAAEEEGRTGESNNYPVSGQYARRISWRETVVALMIVGISLVVVLLFKWATS
jgi:hypothetical protein